MNHAERTSCPRHRCRADRSRRARHDTTGAGSGCRRGCRRRPDPEPALLALVVAPKIDLVDQRPPVAYAGGRLTPRLVPSGTSVRASTQERAVEVRWLFRVASWVVRLTGYSRLDCAERVGWRVIVAGGGFLAGQPGCAGWVASNRCWGWVSRRSTWLCGLGGEKPSSGRHFLDAWPSGQEDSPVSVVTGGESHVEGASRRLHPSDLTIFCALDTGI